MLGFHEASYTTQISEDFEVKRLPSRAMLVLEIYKFHRDLGLELSLNGHALPRCIMRVDWKDRGDNTRSRHHLELLPGLVQVGTNRVVVTRRPEDEGRSLEPVNIGEISIEFDP